MFLKEQGGYGVALVVKGRITMKKLLMVVIVSLSGCSIPPITQEVICVDGQTATTTDGSNIYCYAGAWWSTKIGI